MLFKKIISDRLLCDVVTVFLASTNSRHQASDVSCAARPQSAHCDWLQQLAL